MAKPKKKPVGRPPLPGGRKTLQIGLCKKSYRALVKLAKVEGVSKSEYLRMLLISMGATK